MSKLRKSTPRRLTDSEAEAILTEARPLLLTALVKAGRIPTEPPQDPARARSLLDEPDPDYVFFRSLADGAGSWRSLRQRVDAVSFKLASLAKQEGADPSPALRVAFLMRIALDFPMADLEVSAIVDLASLVSILGEKVSLRSDPGRESPVDDGRRMFGERAPDMRDEKAEARQKLLRQLWPEWRSQKRFTLARKLGCSERTLRADIRHLGLK